LHWYMCDTYGARFNMGWVPPPPPRHTQTRLLLFWLIASVACDWLTCLLFKGGGGGGGGNLISDLPIAPFMASSEIEGITTPTLTSATVWYLILSHLFLGLKCAQSYDMPLGSCFVGVVALTIPHLMASHPCRPATLFS
jgi:hypothetical protein